MSKPLTLEDIRAHRDEILRLAKRYGASNVRVFGSVARGEATVNSDVDFLVDFPPHFSLLDLSGLVREWQQVLHKPVQVASAADLREDMQSSILQDVVAL